MTLKFTKQETFDLVAWHLINQGKRSSQVNPENGKESCLYHGDDGLQCAAGCLIPPGKYHPEMESRCVSDAYMRQFIHEYDGWFGHDMSLVSDLQDIHDDCNPDDWESMLRELAEDLGLNTNILD